MGFSSARLGTSAAAGLGEGRACSPGGGRDLGKIRGVGGKGSALQPWLLAPRGAAGAIVNRGRRQVQWGVR